MNTIRISFENGSVESFRYLEEYGTPSDHAVAILEGIFPEYAERGEIISDGQRWYIEGVAEATWYGSVPGNLHRGGKCTQ